MKCVKEEHFLWEMTTKSAQNNDLDQLDQHLDQFGPSTIQPSTLSLPRRMNLSGLFCPPYLKNQPTMVRLSRKIPIFAAQMSWTPSAAMRGASRHRSTGKPGKFTRVIRNKVWEPSSYDAIGVPCHPSQAYLIYYRCGLIFILSLSQVIPGPSSRLNAERPAPPLWVHLTE